MKPFDHCSICINTAIEPVCCPKGHIFCKSCIIEHLYHQKQIQRDKLEKWKINEAISQVKNEQLKNDTEYKKIDEFVNLQDGIPQYKDNSKFAKFDEPDKIRLKAIEELKSTKKAPIIKDEWYKAAFWTPQNLPSGEQNKESVKPSLSLMCPISLEGEHMILLKKLHTIKFTKNSEGQ